LHEPQVGREDSLVIVVERALDLSRQSIEIRLGFLRNPIVLAKLRDLLRCRVPRQDRLGGRGELGNLLICRERRIERDL